MTDWSIGIKFAYRSAIMARYFFWIIALTFLASCITPNTAFDNATQTSTHGNFKNPLTIYALDVGQGNATLVIGPDHSTGLIDAGPPFSGLTKILPKLRSLKIDSLDWIIISHYDTDHLGGLLEVLKGEDQTWDTDDDIILNGYVWDRGGDKYEETPWYEEYKEDLESRGYRQTINVGQTFDLDHEAQALVVLSDGQYLDGTIHHLNPDEENESSIALLIEYGDFHYLTAGDITGGGFSGVIDTKDLETKLAYLMGPVEVIKLNHHGSRTSTNENYLDILKPEAAIISVGRDNDFGHPHPEVLNRLEERNIEIHRTDEGTVKIMTDGEEFEIGS